ncbi:MAG: cbb3-type cytochrome c oxidase subunit I [Gammaproteobacteria bacterium]|nr:cbb3-type cytochrome c oxidase subunit I [Gammaproteobacteria bacterium]
MNVNYSFTLPIPSRASRRLAAGWLQLGVAALVATGLFSILLVMARTPYIKDLLPWNNFFQTAMVVHVNLSVLMWFLPCAGVIWSYNCSERHLYWGRLALYLAVIGTIIVVISPFVGSGTPLMNNYFPVIESPIFFSGMGLFGIGFALLVIRSLSTSLPLGTLEEGTTGLRVGLYAAAIAAAVALLAIIWSYFAIPDTVKYIQYYETLFWGGGHVLQFTHTLLMMVSWLWLASVSGVHHSLTPRVTGTIFGLGIVLIFVTPLIYLKYDIMSINSAVWFTRLMTAGGGVAALPLGLAIFIGLLRSGKTPATDRSALRTTLYYSIFLFAVGGLFGYLIQQSSTLTTAHYHASNGAITIAFMGLCYLLLPLLGFQKPNLRLANIQLHAFGSGQLLHALGLAWAGGYGMKRKIAGSAQTLDNIQQTMGMMLMGIGGLIAVVGGILFLIVVIRAMWIRSVHQENTGTSH